MICRGEPKATNNSLLCLDRSCESRSDKQSTKNLIRFAENLSRLDPKTAGSSMYRGSNDFDVLFRQASTSAGLSCNRRHLRNQTTEVLIELQALVFEAGKRGQCARPGFGMVYTGFRVIASELHPARFKQIGRCFPWAESPFCREFLQ